MTVSIALECPICVSDAPLRVVGGAAHQLMGGPATKHPHLHDPNLWGLRVVCANGHAFKLQWHPSCPADGCDWMALQGAGDIGLVHDGAYGPPSD